MESPELPATLEEIISDPAGVFSDKNITINDEEVILFS